MKTVFIRAIEAAVDEKAAVLREAVQAGAQSRFDADVSTFSQVPRSPFAYWTSAPTRDAFSRFQPLETDIVHARQGGVPGDDFRRLRLAWEVVPGKNLGWQSYAKGGKFACFYSDFELLVKWDRPRRSFHAFTGLPHRPSLQPASSEFYFRPGLTWSRRTQGGLSFRIMPRDFVFADKGPSVFVDGDNVIDLLALASIANSRVFVSLVEVQMAFGSYEVGVIQRTPVPGHLENNF